MAIHFNNDYQITKKIYVISFFPNTANLLIQDSGGSAEGG